MTKNFSKSEFESKCGREMPKEVYHNVVKVANQLQYLRGEIGKPIKVNSAYRSPEHNAKVGGVPKSQHLLGKAADIVVNGMIENEGNFKIPSYGIRDRDLEHLSVEEVYELIIKNNKKYNLRQIQINMIILTISL